MVTLIDRVQLLSGHYLPVYHITSRNKAHDSPLTTEQEPLIIYDQTREPVPRLLLLHDFSVSKMAKNRFLQWGYLKFQFHVLFQRLPLDPVAV